MGLSAGLDHPRAVKGSWLNTVLAVGGQGASLTATNVTISPDLVNGRGGCNVSWESEHVLVST